MGKLWDEYLNRKTNQRSKSPFREAADLTTSRMAPKFEEIKGKTEDMFRKEGASPMAKAKFALNEESKIIDQYGNIYSEAAVRDIARKDELTAEIDKVQLKIDQEDEAERKAKKGRVAQTFKTAAEVLGTVGGTVATGGNIQAGLAIGKGAGGIVDVVTGLDESYDSPENIASGAGNILSGMLSTKQAVSQQALTTLIQERMSDISNLPAKEIEIIMMKYEMGLNSGYDGAAKFTAWFNETYPATPIKRIYRR